MIKSEIIPLLLDAPSTDHEHVHEVGANKIVMLMHQRLTYTPLQIPLYANSKPSTDDGSAFKQYM